MKRKTIYAWGVFLFSVFLLGTVGALEQGTISCLQGFWQTIIGIAGGGFFWNLLRIEENRAVRRGRMSYIPAKRKKVHRHKDMRRSA
ncbi:MAG: hypothetical protein IJM27_06015 [Eubacterium sp.]|jgi:hypothetical protein|nr:hypothetical protein [Eubacterium sp.]